MRLFAMSWMLVLCAGLAAAAGANTPMGAVIENAPISGPAAANVIVFFKPDQQNMLGTLQALAACEKELEGQSVKWVAVVPARYSADEAKAMATQAGFKMPVTVDAGDALHDRIGVTMHPTVAILDKDRRLTQFQPYTRLNFCESVMARVRRVLGELDDAGLARALDPTAEQPSGASSAARRDLKLAEMLFKSGNLDKALELAKTGVSHDPKSAEAHALVGKILATKGDCAGATVAFDTSLKLQAGQPNALAGKKMCSGR
jgi:hypothetical protein